jgi:hypothetical protein
MNLLESESKLGPFPQPSFLFKTEKYSLKDSLKLSGLEHLLIFMDFLGKFIPMLNWDFVKADPITYRATYGAIRFEVTVGADNRKNAVTVTRTEGDKFEIKTISGSRKSVAVV